MKKRILAITLALTMLFSTVSVAAADASDFSDMPDNFATESLLAAVENGLLTGNDGKIMPYDNLTRAQMATILVRAFGGDGSADLSSFDDVPTTAWYYDDLSSAVAMGIFQGNGSMMYPDAAITRQEAFVVLARAFALDEVDTDSLDSFVDSDLVGSWAAPEVAAMVATGYVQGNGTNLYPTNTISRQEFAVVMDRMVETYISEAGDYTDLADGSVMVNTPDVTLSDMTIYGDLIIGDGVGDGDITLDDVTVTGHLVVRGGGMNSIVITGDSEIQGTVKVVKVDGEVRVSVEGNASVEVIYVNDGLDDIIVEGAFESLVVDYSSIVYAVDATIGTIDVHAEEAIVILSEGTSVGSATIHETAISAQIILEDDTAAGTITVAAEDATVTLEDGAAVETVVTTETATDATIEVEDGATVETVEAAGEGTTITGDGDVETVTVTADNTTVETAGTTVEVADDVSGTTADGDDVAAGDTVTTDTTTTTTTTSSSSSSSGSSSTYYTVTFDTQGGDAISSYSVKKNNSTTLPTPTYGENVFVEWNTTATGSGTPYAADDAYTVTGNVIFYAIWASSITEATIDEIIDGGMWDVNSVIYSNGDYATLSWTDGDYDSDDHDDDVTVNITDGSVTVTNVYNHIISTLLSALSTHDDKVDYIMVGTAKLELDETLTVDTIKEFVKASGLHGEDGELDEIDGNDKLEVLYNQSMTVEVYDINGSYYSYIINFVGGITEDVVDEIIDGGMYEVNTKISDNGGYATLAWANAGESSYITGDDAITVTITDGTETVTNVYDHIINTLLSALDDHAAKVDYITVGSATLTVGTTLTMDDIKNFVKDSGLTGTGTDDEIMGYDVLSVLYNQSMTVVVYDINGVGYTYVITFKCGITEAQVDEIIDGGMWAVNQIINTTENYASMAWTTNGGSTYVDGTNDTITVTITDNTETVTDVYYDIIDTLVDALNEHASELDTVQVGESSAISVDGEGWTYAIIENLVKTSGLTNGADGTISGNETLNVLDGQSVIVIVTDVNGIAYTYTITFTDSTPA